MRLRPSTSPTAAEMLDIVVERARQQGYDEGYADGSSVRPTVTRLRSRRAFTDGSAAHELGEKDDV